MAKTKGHAENFRVVIYPRGLGNFGFMSVGDRTVTGGDPAISERMYRDRCNDIAEQVRRHVDEVGSVDVEFDTQDVCEHCGREWTESSPAYNGGCCDQDQSAEDQRVTAGGA